MKAALDPKGWQEFVDYLTEKTDGICTHMFGYDLRNNASMDMVNAGYDPSMIQSYADYYGAFNPWIDGFAKAEVGAAVHCDWMIPQAELMKTEFYNDWILPQEDIVGGGGSILFSDDERVYLIGGNIRRADLETKQQFWLDTVSAIAPQMQLAIEINRTIAGLSLEKWAAEQNSLGPGTAILIIDQNRRVRYSSELGQSMLSQGSLIKTDLQGALKFTDRSAAQKLDAVLKRSRTGLGGASATFMTPHPEKAICRIMGFNTGELDFQLHNMLLLSPSTLFLISIQTQQQTSQFNAFVASELGLSQSEAEISILLSEDYSIKEIAETRRVSIHTVRNQLKSAMSKTYSRRQSELVKLIERLKFFHIK